MKAPDYQIIIIGAGVVGLGIARGLAEAGYHSVLVIEKEESFGRGVSSRNSEVIHSGIYYPKNSLKAKYCLLGRDLLYSFCKDYSVWHQRCGKLIIAQKHQSADLEQLYANAKKNGVPGLKMIVGHEITEYEPKIRGDLGMVVDCSGIISSHELMNTFYSISVQAEHDYLFKSQVVKSQKISAGYKISIENPTGEIETIITPWVINSSGLQSDIIANLLPHNKPLPKLSYSKGCYFKLSSIWCNQFQHLVYPLPDKETDSLGIHLSIDQSGAVKLGPNARWLANNEENYSVEEDLRNLFFKKVSAYVPEIKEQDLSPDYAGIRPKIKTVNNIFSDYYIVHEEDAGFPGWINLIGVDSPGLTAAIAIGEDIASWI